MQEPSRSAQSSRLSLWFPEGAIVPVLLLVLIAIASFSVQFGGWSSLVIPVGVLGVVAGVFGLVIAKARVADSIAHMGGLVIGVGVVFTLLLFEANSLGEGWRDRVRPLGTFLIDWYLGRRSSAEHEDLLISMLMGLIVWLVGYLSAWVLFRRGWLMAAVLLPGLLATVNLGYAENARAWLLGAMLAVAIPLGARYHLYQRQQIWTNYRMPSPLGLGRRIVLTSMLAAVLITGLSWQAPSTWSQSNVQPFFEKLTERVTATQDRASDWLDHAAATGERVQDAGSYTAFDDAFSVGGPLDLSDREEILVRADVAQAPYLTAHSYDVYTGQGWASGIDDSFARTGPDGERYSPELLFREGQSVVLSPNVTTDRVAQTIGVTPLGGESGVIFSIDTYQSASIPAVVRMSWRQLDDEAFAVSAESLTSLPPDIQLISSYLTGAQLTGPLGEHGPQAVDPEQQARIDAELESLRGRMVSVRWEADAEGGVQTLYVSGQLPVYDDVEAAFPRNAADSGVSGSYQVTGLTSAADDQDLSNAGTSYPAWVTDRYLQLGDTVTPRTIELALDIAGGAANPYEQAVLVEQWLRSNIAYDDRVAAPPDDADVVDYTLFELGRGYCEHFSSSMTVMMRALGVPARTVVGYYPGEYDEARGGFLYRQLNAHAWTEVFFPAYGWIPFEPTANRPLSEREMQESEAAASPEATEVLPESTPADEQVQSESTPAVEPPTLENLGPPMMTTVDEDGGVPDWVLPVGAGSVMLAVVAGGAWLRWHWKLRGLPQSSALFSKLVRVGRLGGVKPSPTMTPREYAANFSESLPLAGSSARRIVQVYELDQYGSAEVDAGRLAAAGEAWRQVRSQVPRLLLRRRRQG
ncbi:MAG TPA: DUF4129 domain-containing transglutaminase family protein [Thermomicrobiales bacterium]|nr:DUF4129 domain-containing transglutaminase family protein [Thermomicrobiales bacterium]